MEHQSGWGKVPKRRGEQSWGAPSPSAKGVQHQVIASQTTCVERGNWEPLLSHKGACSLVPTEISLLWGLPMLIEFPARSWRVGSSGTRTFIQIFHWIPPQVLLISNRFYCELIWFPFSTTSCSANKNSWLWTLKFSADFCCGFIPGFL